MEDALAQIMRSDQSKMVVGVLILVVMEDALARVEDIAVVSGASRS